MDIQCGKCKSGFKITNEQFRGYSSNLSISCPECNSDIVISRLAIKKAVNSLIKSLPFGDELKEKIVKEVEDLPPMPQVAIKARQVVSNSKSNAQDLANVIEQDQAITTRVLKLANSPFYGSRGEVATVQKAAVVLGTKTLYELLTMACASGFLGERLEGYDLDAGDLWMHSLAVASGSRILSERFMPELKDDAFSAGLIHDSGKLILDSYILERKIAFMDFLLDERQTFLDAEKHTLGFDHAEIAYSVCLKWNMPEYIANAIRYHHTPALSSQKELSSIIHLADAIAMMSGLGVGFDGMLYKLDESVMESLNIGESDLNIIMQETAGYVSRVVEQT